MSEKEFQFLRNNFTEKLSRFVDKKSGGSYICSVCSKDKFIVIGGSNVNEENIKNSPDNAYRTLAISCINCGHIEFFSSNIVLNDKDWE